MIARRGLRAILIGPSNEKIRPGSKLPEGFNKSACLKLFALDGDRDAMIVGQATTGRNSAAPVSSSSSSVTAEPFWRGPAAWGNVGGSQVGGMSAEWNANW